MVIKIPEVLIKAFFLFLQQFSKGLRRIMNGNTISFGIRN